MAAPAYSCNGPIAVLGMAADLELNFIQDRQRAGIDAARAKGIYKGRRKSLPVDEIRRLSSLGLKKAKIARQLGISRVSGSASRVG